MKFNCIQIGLTIHVTKELLEKFKSLGRDKYPLEYGGILVGHYEDDGQTAVIVDTILPIRYKSSKFNFERSNEGFKEKLEELYKQTPKLIYIGEWHTHPDLLAIPSQDDYDSIKAVAHHPDVQIKNPIMLIIGIGKKRFVPNFFVFYNDKLFMYEQETGES